MKHGCTAEQTDSSFHTVPVDSILKIRVRPNGRRSARRLILGRVNQNGDYPVERIAYWISDNL